MSPFEEERPVKRISHEIGAELSALAVDELNARIALLQQEISRIESEIVAKSSSRSVAEGLFKPKRPHANP